MASTDIRGTKTAGHNHHSGKAAARYPETDAASTTDIEEDLDTHDSDAEGAMPWRLVAAEANTRKSRATGAPQHQTLLSGRVFQNGRQKNVVSHRDPDESSHWTQAEPSAAAYGLQPAALASLLQHSSGSTGLTGCSGRRHPNGLPARQPSGPLPGMPFLNDLISRYPVRQAPASGPQVSLISGQLYVSDRLRVAMSAKKARSTLSTPNHPYLGFPAPDTFVPTYIEQPFPPSRYMQQRRAEKEQRALYTGQHQQPTSSRLTWSQSEAVSPGVEFPETAGHATAAGPAGTSVRNGSVSNGRPGNARQRDLREGVERWLETNDSCMDEEEASSGSPSGRPDISNDPSLMYRQYGIFRTYGKQLQGLRPSTSMPTVTRNGQRVAFDRKRSSSGAGAASPVRPSSQPVTWNPARQSVW